MKHADIISCIDKFVKIKKCNPCKGYFTKIRLYNGEQRLVELFVAASVCDIIRKWRPGRMMQVKRALIIKDFVVRSNYSRLEIWVNGGKWPMANLEENQKQSLEESNSPIESVYDFVELQITTDPKQVMLLFWMNKIKCRTKFWHFHFFNNVTRFCDAVVLDQQN